MRINKYIARCGEASRRAADELIQKGKVSVNGKVLKEPGYDVQEGDEVRLFGRVITPETKNVYYLLNKPIGYVTTTMDKEGRPTVLDLVQAEGIRLFPVGRLDYNTSGLLILTNDGDLSNRLMHPSKEFPNISGSGCGNRYLERYPQIGKRRGYRRLYYVQGRGETGAPR